MSVKELSSGGRSGVISRDNPLHVDHINRFWDRFSAAMRDKDLAIQAELSRHVYFILYDSAFLRNSVELSVCNLHVHCCMLEYLIS